MYNTNTTQAARPGRIDCTIGGITMKFEQFPKRCYLCCKPFSQAVKAIPVIGGKCAPGYICPVCHDKLLFRNASKGVNTRNSNKDEENIMTKELYDELKQIEERLFYIANEFGEIFEGELGDAWSSLYSYLEKMEVNDLE